MSIVPTPEAPSLSDGDAPTVLLIDDRPGHRESIGLVLRAEGYVVVETDTISKALTYVRRDPPNVVVSDVRLDTHDAGLRLLQVVRDQQPGLPIILYTGFPAIPDAVRALRLGAFDYIEFPVDAEVLLLAVSDALRVSPSRRMTLRQPYLQPFANSEEIVAASRAMQDVMRRVKRVARTKLPVLITGETGTGKELVAHAVHSNSDRASRGFVPVNCGGIPEALAESELFGYRKGSFTGALANKPGLVTEADGGTLFLDEVAELSPALQASLLRFLASGEIRPLGDNKVKRVDVRIVAATNRQLDHEVAERRLREDLFFRLKAAMFHVPPLRERLEDLDALVALWLPRLSAQVGVPVRRMAPNALSLLHRYSWQGNIRELYHVLELAVAMSESELISVENLGPEFTALAQRDESAGGRGPDDTHNERERLLRALQEHRWNASDTAASLGINRKTLWRWRRRFRL